MNSKIFEMLIQITSKLRFFLIKYIKDYILNSEANIEGISYRSLEFSILRIAYALALLERSKIKNSHINFAIELKDAILKNFIGITK